MKKVIGFEEAKKILDRSQRQIAQASSVEASVKDILNNVAQNGDTALFEYTEKFDHIKLDSLLVSSGEISAAYDQVGKTLISELMFAANRITSFYQQCRNHIKFRFEHEGLGRITRPLNRVGVYVPGGTAAYPSTVLMTAIPAKVAGVNEVIMVSPAQKNGSLPAATMVAADIAKVDKIFKIGGAQAIAAMAYGTKTIPAVDKICGPGNIYVATAKRLVYGTVDIDGIQGPSEVIVIADSNARPAYCAADLIAQSEHDEMATSVLITDSEDIANKVEKEVFLQMSQLPRKDIISKAINNNAVIAVVNDISEAIQLANLFAPEHLLLMVKDAKKYLDAITNAGCVFVGENSPVAIGDYVAGPSHVLPTGGTSVFTSPLSIESFLKTTNFVALTKSQQNDLGPVVIDLATAEGLDAHAKAVKIRMQEKNDNAS
jgi:histidinol dehydrogenase